MTLDVIGPYEVFSLAAKGVEQNGGRSPYQLYLVAETLDPVVMFSGVTLQPSHTFETCPRSFDTLVVPGSALLEAVLQNEKMLRWIDRQAPRARRVVSICTGAFFLAELGLLDGKSATTHWAYSTLLRERYPNVEVQPDSIYIRDGATYTSAGITAGMDLSISLVEEDLGKELAMAVARLMVVFYRRPGGQNQFSEVLVSQSSAHFSSLIEWIMDNLDDELSVERLAARANMSPRNFARLFRQELKETPAKFVEKVRLQHVRALLGNKRLSLKEIATRSGFKSEEQMRRAFRRELSVTPQEYRERF